MGNEQPPLAQEISRLRALNRELVEALEGMSNLVQKAQDILGEYLEPEGTKEDAIDGLLGLLDGPKQREAQRNARAVLARARKEG